MITPRSLLPALCCAGSASLAAALLAPAAASAGVVTIGQTNAPLSAPVCPKGSSASNCRIVLERTTAIQSTSAGVRNATLVKQNGWIVAFSVGISRLSPNAKTVHTLLHGLDQVYGGTPQLRLTVLRPRHNNTYTVRAQTGNYHLIPFLGRVLTQAMSQPPKFKAFTALPVRKGDLIALTVPTWAPVLNYNLSSTKFAYRQSRTQNCTKAAGAQTAQLRVGSTRRYGCSYTGTRVEYSATEVTNVPYPKHYPH